MTIYNETMSDGVLVDGDVVTTIDSNLIFEDGVLLDGSPAYGLVLSETASDGVLIDGVAQVVQNFEVDLFVKYAVNNEITSQISFSWSVGELPFYWWVVEGYVHPPDSTSYLDISVPEKQNFIQTILARTPKEVGEIFARENVNWEIVYLKKWTQPADPYLVNPAVPNTLVKVDYKFPSFSISNRPIIKIGFFSDVVRIFQIYQGSGGAKFYGNAETVIASGGTTPTTASYNYVSSGNIVYTGGTATASSSFQTNFLNYLGLKTILLSEFIFGLGQSNTLAGVTNTVATACGTCDAFPYELYLENNFSNPGLLGNFLQRNGFEFSTLIPMIYSSRSNSWVGYQHFQGMSDDNKNDENWRFQFEFGCTNSPFGQEDATSSPVLKFSILVTRKNLGTNYASDTRIIIVFSSADVCDIVRNFKNDFVFSLNTKTTYINNPNGITPLSVLLNDKIGLFKSTFWTTNPNLSFRMSATNFFSQSENKNISQIIPSQPTLSQTGAGFTNSTVNV